MWKTIEEFDNFEVSEDGRVRNRFTLKEKKITIKQGRPTVHLCQGKRKTFYVSHLVAQHFYVLPEKVRKLVDQALSLNLLSEDEVRELFVGSL